MSFKYIENEDFWLNTICIVKRTKLWVKILM